MKPFLGIDLTTDKKNERINGDEFLIATPSSSMEQSYERSTERAEEIIEKAKLPLPLRTIQGVCGFLGLIFAVGLMRALSGEDSVTLSQAYGNAPWMFWLIAVCLPTWGILKVMSNKKTKTVLDNDESTSAMSNLESIENAIFAEMNVPSNAIEIDVLSFLYKNKGDRIKACTRGLQVAEYLNPVFKIYVDNQNLYLANLDGKYAFPLSSLQAIRTVKKSIRIISWNKEEEYNKGIYKQYKLNHDNYGCIICKCYHILEVNQNGELWGIYIPNYELPIFEQLTGLKAE